jgi:hypothetical protein
MSAARPVFVRLQRAWPVTIGVHVFQCLFAATFALPFVRSVSVPGVLVSPQVAEWIGSFRLGDAFEEGAALRALLPVALAVLNYPWLSVAWLRALSEEAPFTEHAQFALGRYRAALSVAAATGLGLAALAAVSGVAAYGVGVALRTTLDERALDLARLACFVPSLIAAVWVVTAQDAAYAAISGGAKGWQTIARATVQTGASRLAVHRCVLIGGQAVLALAAWVIPRLALGPGTAADFVVLVATQSVAFVITCLRAVWLAWVLEAINARQ